MMHSKLGWAFVWFAIVLSLAIPLLSPELTIPQLLKVYWWAALTYGFLLIAGGWLVLAAGVTEETP